MATSRYALKLTKFFEFADSLAGLSTCKRSQCGAIIFPVDCSRVLAVGYNGPPSMFNNDSCSGVEGSCGCIHAETNAIVKFGVVKEPCVMYCTTMACEMCARLILNCPSIVAFAWKRPYRNDRGLKLLNGRVALLNVERMHEDREYVNVVELLDEMRMGMR